GLGNGDFLAAPIGQANVFDDVILRHPCHPSVGVTLWARPETAALPGLYSTVTGGCNKDIKNSLYPLTTSPAQGRQRPPQSPHRGSKRARSGDCPRSNASPRRERSRYSCVTNKIPGSVRALPE